MHGSGAVTFRPLAYIPFTVTNFSCPDNLSPPGIILNRLENFFFSNLVLSSGPRYLILSSGCHEHRH